MSRRISTLVLPTLALAFLAQTAMAAGEELGALPSPKQGLITGITALVVFAVVFAILAVKVWPVIGKALDERAGKIREEIAAAEAARKQAKDALEMYEKSLAEARAEAQKMLEKTRAQQQALADELRSKADAEAAKKAALQEIYAQTAAAATSIAGKILRREVNAADQKRLVEESMGELMAMKN
jgi:F0F1-type ATP synthase membrane subunit b/b'